MEALLWCLLISLTYTGSLYIFNKGTRNELSTIKRRMLLNFVVVTFQITTINAWIKFPFNQIFKLCGIMIILVQILTLYAGEILRRCIVLNRHWKRDEPLINQFSEFLNDQVHFLWNLMSFRDYVWAPLSEELVFRVLMIHLMQHEGYTIRACIFIPPIFFGSCHVHHFYDMVYVCQYSAVDALQIVAFQFLYTYLFGAYSGLVLIKTKSLLACVVAHSLCNFLGLPSLNGLNGRTQFWFVILVFLVGIMGFIIQVNQLAVIGIWWC
eukprot:TRINITY_DN7399_c0_g1_i3.p2 TRINITY_DN7399_c0_g1~~TRINITY_DN7399_c0_g1_i3.p2  ORF type:complete len:267 (-),score=-5.23 TRINITY_DN7399_c0_g1_i3:94-894(-)